MDRLDGILLVVVAVSLWLSADAFRPTPVLEPEKPVMAWGLPAPPVPAVVAPVQEEFASR